MLRELSSRSTSLRRMSSSNDISSVRYSFTVEIREVVLPGVKGYYSEYSDKLVSVFLERGNKIAKTTEILPVEETNGSLSVHLNESLTVTTGLTQDSNGVMQEKKCKLYVRYRKKGLVSGDSLKTIGEATIYLNLVAKAMTDSVSADFKALHLDREIEMPLTKGGTVVFAKISASIAEENADDCASLASERSWMDTVQRNPAWKLENRNWVRNFSFANAKNQETINCNPFNASETSSQSSNASEDESAAARAQAEISLRTALARAAVAETRVGTLEDEVVALRAQLRESNRQCSELSTALTDSDGHPQPPQTNKTHPSFVPVQVYDDLLEQHVTVKVKLATAAVEVDEQRIMVFNLTQDLQRYAGHVEELESTLMEMRHWVAESMPQKPSRERGFFWGYKEDPSNSGPSSGKTSSAPPAVLGIGPAAQPTYTPVLPSNISTSSYCLDLERTETDV